jgi:hypothetical protein
MGLFKPLFFFVLAFFAVVALFIGAITLLTSLQNGAISVSYTMNGRVIDETVSRAAESARFWRYLGLWAGLPLVIGAGALWYSVRKLRS